MKHKNASGVVRRLVVILPSILSALLAWSAMAAESNEVVEVTLEQSSPKGGTAGRQEIFDKAIETASLRYIQEMIGEQKVEKYQTLIRNKVLRQSGKYVLFIKGTAIGKSPEGGLKMQVSLKLGLKSLEALLLDEGLLYRMDGPPRILPMIVFVDRVTSQAYSWWSRSASGETGSVAPQVVDLNLQLRKAARDKGFFVLEPVSARLVELVPEAFLTENPPTEDLLFFGEYFSAQILIKGIVAVSQARDRSDSYKIDVRLSAMHATNARVVGEVIRSYDTEAGPYAQVVPRKLSEVFERISQDLAGQIHETWKSGTFGANALRLAISGSLDYQQLSQFKKLVLSSIKDIRNMKERLFAPGRVVFEVDAESNSKQLGEKFGKLSLPRFKVEVNGVKTEGLDLSVKAL